MSTRRVFLRDSALAMIGTGAAPLWLERALYAAEAPAPRKKILIAIFQRGAADGLNIVVPHGEPAYYALRPTIAIPRPRATGDKQADAAIDLDGFFGLHPSLAPLKPLFDQGHLAVVDAVGSPDATRSHFDAQDYMESGTPGVKATTDGWMNRALPAKEGNVSPLRALSLGSVLPRSLRGPQPAIALQSVGDFQIRNAQAAKSFEQLYLESPDATLRATAEKRSKRLLCCRPFKSSRTARRAVPNIRAAVSAKASGRSPSSSRPKWAWRWRSQTSAAGTITSTNWASGLPKANWPTCGANTDRRSVPSGRIWATAWVRWSW